MDRTLVALDLETTGLSPGLDRVIEVGAVRFNGDGVLERFQSLVRPDVAIPEAVQQLTGISDADVREAPDAEGVLKRLVEFVGNSPVVAHSGSFDLYFLYGPRSTRPLYDTLELARILLPTYASHSLPQLCRELGLDHRQPHRALPDAEAAQQLFLRLLEVASGLPAELKEQLLQVSGQCPGPIDTFMRMAGKARPGTHKVAQAPIQPAPSPSRSGGAPLERPEQIKEWLGPDGPLPGLLSDYEVREEQQQMALAIAQLLERGGRLVIEAAPGTGKSLAYLLPAVQHAVRKQERVVVATNTITLQEQLFLKDVPFLKSTLPFDFKASLLKGRSNYLSLRRWNAYLNEPIRLTDPGAEEEVKFKLRMLVWLGQTVTGDRSEIKLSGTEEYFWQRAASTADDCLAARCLNYRTQRCFYWNSRKSAQEADLVITNHSLLLADALGNGNVLPPFKHLVVDEAHQLEETALETMVRRVGAAELSDSLFGLSRWSKSALGQLPDDSKRALTTGHEAINQLFQSVATLLRQLLPESNAAREIAILTPLLREDPRIAALVEEARTLLPMVTAAATGLSSLVEAEVEAGRVEQSSYALHEVDLFQQQLQQRVRVVEAALCKPSAQHLYWLALERRSGRPLVQSAALQAGDLFRERALEGKETAVFTSATLAVAGSFDYFKRGLGLSDAATHEMILEAPFDYLSQALLCLPTDLLPLDSPEFTQQTSTIVAAVASAIGGRTLVLFTSHQQLQEVAAHLESRLAAGLRVLAQNVHGTRRQLLTQFQENPGAVLLGSSSFWEGIDIPGDTLSCVIIVRLPFKVPTDPMQVARAAGVRDPFAEIALPDAVLRLKQGFGRLIRKRSDRGAAIVLDQRIANRAYGRAFIEALPRAEAFVGLSPELPDAVKQWLAR